MLKLCVICVCLISEAAMAASAIQLVIDSPRGGELYVPGQQQTVVLGAKTVAKSILVELSRDGGTTFVPLGTIDNSRRSTPPILQWTVPTPASSNAVIRVTSTDSKHSGSAT